MEAFRLKEDGYRVSIITVVRNGVETIEQTILSVLGQTYKNIEYIIIEGQSTDGTLQIIEKYSRFIDSFISEPDEGLYDAMNKGIRRATGEIIGIINSDDWYAEDAVERVVNYLNGNNVDVVYGNVIHVYQDGSEKLWKKMPLETIRYRTAVQHPSVFIKKEIYYKYGGFDLDYAVSADYELLLRLYSKDIRFGFVNSIVAYYRRGGFSSKFYRKGIAEHREISLKYINSSPDKIETLAKIKDWYNWSSFSLEIKNKKQLLAELLCTYFQKSLQKISIFGTGIWSEECYRALQEEIEVAFFGDNDSAKWNKEIHGIKVITPQEICDKDEPILIAVRDDGEKIKEQLKRIKNVEFQYVCLSELVDIFIEANFGEIYL